LFISLRYFVIAGGTDKGSLFKRLLKLRPKEKKLAMIRVNGIPGRE
jgi:hypothetical protein